MKIVQNPVATCDQVYALIQSLTSQIRKRMEDPKSAGERTAGVTCCLQTRLAHVSKGSVFPPDLQLYHSETLELMLQRWSKLERDFRMKNGRYDISKIPDIYDCVKYDVIHNATLGLEDTLELFRLSRALADIVIPQVRWREEQLNQTAEHFNGLWNDVVMTSSQVGLACVCRSTASTKWRNWT